MDGNYAILAPILFPVIAGIVLFNIRSDSRLFRNIYVTAVMFLTGVLDIFAFASDNTGLFVWNLAKDVAVYFNADGVAKFIVSLVTVVWFLVGIYSFEYMKHEGKEKSFYGFYLVVLGIITGAGYAGNLVTFYVIFEFMTLMTVPFVLHERTKESVAAAKKYLFYSVAGASMALAGIFIVFAETGSIGFAAGGIMHQAGITELSPVLAVGAMLTIVGFGTKAGMFPMHGWLPTAHPVAPAPASALLSGIITKIGVVGIIRVIFFVYGPDILKGTWVQYAFMTLALITVFMGSMLAYKEQNFKKRLAYSTTSQVSYVLFGLSLLSDTGFTGAMLHVVFHSCIKSILFLTAGVFIYKLGKRRADELTGVGKQMPVTMWCYTLASLALVGIPPLSGFVSKWFLAEASLESGIKVYAYLGPAVLLISALLTAGYLLVISLRGFFPGEDHFGNDEIKSEEPNLLMTVPLIIFTIATVVMGMFPTPLISYIQDIAGSIF